MPVESQVMGIFGDDRQAASAIAGLRETPWRVKRVHMPFPSEKIRQALKPKKSLVGWFTLVGGIVGFFSGFGLAAFTAVQWDLIVSGKPVIALIPFFIVGFEFTILLSVFGNVLGLLILARLPRMKNLAVYDPRCSRDRFGVLAACHPQDEAALAGFFRNIGGEAEAMETGQG